MKEKEIRAMITANEAFEIEQRLANLEAWIDANGHRSRSGWVSYPAGSEPADCKVSNDERAQLELRNFMIQKPERYFLYIKLDPRHPDVQAQIDKGVRYTDGFRRGIATTWTGEKLGDVICGSEWQDNFGGRRVPVTIKAVNGCTYHGTYYKSSGDYARVKKAVAR